MYQVEDYVVYGNEGVCKIEAIEKLDITGANVEKVYYVLQPIYRSGTVYTPVDTKVSMRPVISKEAAQTLIEGIPSIQAEIDGPTNATFLKNKYTEMLLANDCEELIQLIKTVNVKEDIAEKKNKKLGQTDKHYLRKAEDLLYSEFAIALGIPINKVQTYIKERIETHAVAK
ncbi:MAG TPA: CarD family transcriptional regulator [Candidatus Jeotgalibaca pullicola]|uniref:CarD-like/TRCF RNAP-interacting domain-containing protein n=1 Tax=Jeotgalibaca ciconiae TaxID=2496265 RepID=A0A3S9HBF1_9LACT|nr:hypothetical protein EJN90_08395 [Jeotgalibaca ciconiae]HJB22568.1 CarD family transcriptional regulator [Candidatus Jeotgalibaca pullicola]